MNTAIRMYNIHTDAREAIHKLSEESGIGEKDLLEMLVEVLTIELHDFKPESGERLTEEEMQSMFDEL